MSDTWEFEITIQSKIADALYSIGFEGSKLEYNFSKVCPFDLISVLNNYSDFNGEDEWVWTTYSKKEYILTLLITGSKTRILATFDLWKGLMTLKLYE